MNQIAQTWLLLTDRHRGQTVTSPGGVPVTFDAEGKALVPQDVAESFKGIPHYTMVGEVAKVADVPAEAAPADADQAGPPEIAGPPESVPAEAEFVAPAAAPEPPAPDLSPEILAAAGAGEAPPPLTYPALLAFAKAQGYESPGHKPRRVDIEAWLATHTPGAAEGI